MTVETFLANFERLADAPNGIPKLRDLILQLAVRGKLVPQDPNDEPASELLKKIEAAKQCLIAKGTIRKTKLLPSVELNERPFDLPGSWEWTRVGQLAEVVRGVSYKKHEASTEPAEGLVPVLRANNIDGELNTEKLVYVPSDRVSPEQCIRQWDILIAMSSGSASLVGKAAQAETNLDAGFGAFCGVVRFVPGLNPRYERLYFHSPQYRSAISSSSRGIGINNLRKSDLQTTMMPIPPLAEQERIAANVDDLTGLCDELEAKQKKKRTTQISLNRACLHALTSPDGKDQTKAWHRLHDHFDDLYTVPETVAELRQTILQLAVMGRLVPQDPNDLPAPRPGKHFVYALECEDGSIYIGQTQDVVERWKQHVSGQGADWTRKHAPIRLVHWEEFDSLEEAVQREKDLKTGFGRKWLKREIAASRTRQAGEPASVLLARIQAEKHRLIAEGKIRKPKPLAPVAPDEAPYILPSSWEWVRLGELGLAFQNGLAKRRATSGRSTVVLRLADIVLGRVSLADTREILLTPDERAKYDLLPSDILITRVNGSIDLVGAFTLVRVEEDIAYCDHFIRARLLHDHIAPRFLELFGKSRLCRDAIEGVFITTAGQKTVNQRHISALLFALPPLAEQERIVAKVDQLMALCDDLETKLTQTQQDANELLASIVHKLTTA